MQAGATTIKLMADIADVQRKFADIQKVAKSTVDGVGKAFGSLGLQIGAALSVGGLAAWVKSAINAADEMSKLAQKTGVAVKDVAGLQLAFRQSGVSAEQLVPIMAKLGVAITNGNDALKAMGIQSRNTDGTLKSTRQVLGEVSGAFAGYQDGAAKTALAVKLFGEEGAKLMPLLNGGAEALDNFDAMALKLGLTLDEQTARQAEKFNDTLDLMGQGMQGVGRQVAAQLLPTLSGLADQFFTSMSEGDRLRQVAQFLGNILKGLYVVALGVVEVFTTVGKTLGGVSAVIVNVLQGNFTVAADIARQLKEDLTGGWRDTLGKMEQAWNATGSAAFEAMATSNAQLKQQAPLIAASTKATEDQKKADQDALKQRIAAAKYANAQWDEDFKRMEDARDATEKQIRTGRELLEQIEFETRLLEMNTEQRALATMERDLERQGIVKGTLAYDAYIAKLREAMSIKTGKEAGIKAADDMRQAQQKAAEESSKYWEDALMRAFESGKGFFESLWETIKNTLKTQVLRVMVSATGMTGMSAGAGDLGGSLATGNMLGVASSLSNIYNTITSGFGALGDSVAFAANDVGAWLVNNTSGMLNQAGAKLMQSAGTFGTVAGYAAGAAAGLAVGSAISGKYGSNDVVVAGTVIGSIVGGPLGGAIGGAVGGLWNRAFGQGATEMTGSGTRGTFSGSQFSGNNYTNYKRDGGWFSSGSSWTDNTAMAAQTQQAWSNAFAAVKNSVTGMAASLGLATDKVAAYSRYVDIAAGTTSEQLTALFTSMADSMALAAAPGLAQFSRAGESASATFGRLSGSLQVVNQWLGVLDKSLLSISLNGADAASKLVDTFGGLEAMATANKAYYDIFWTDAERLADTATNVAKGLALVGVAMPASKDAFRSIVSSLNLTTDAGRNAYAVMLALAPEFAQVADAAEAARKATESMSKSMTEAMMDAMEKAVSSGLTELRSLVQTAEADLVDAFNSAASALADTASRFASIQDIFKGFAQSLSGAAGTGQSMAFLSGEFDRLSNLARLGDTTAASSAVGVGDQLAAKIIATSSSRSQADAQLARLAAKANATASIAEQQKTIAQQQLETMREVVGKLVDVESKTLSVEEAMQSLRVLQSIENSSIASAIAGGFGNLLASSSLNLDGVAKSTAAIAKGNELSASILSGINTMAGIQQAQEAERVAIAKAAEDERLKQSKISALNQTGLSAAQAFESASSAQNTAVGGVRSSVNDMVALVARYGATMLDSSGAAAKVGVGADGLFSSNYYQTSGISTRLFPSFIAEFYKAGGVYDRTYGQAGALSELASQVKSASADLESQRAAVRALGGTPAFATGGMHSGGLRLVGENGPELEATGPSRIYSAQQTAGMLGGGGAVASEIRALREEVSLLRHEARATASNTGKSTRLLERVTRDGDAMQTVAVV